MIIKSMARKQPSFGQLIDYLDRDAVGHTGTMLAHNLYGHVLSRNAIEAEFLNNHSHLPTRKNGNALFHEVLVLEHNETIPKSRQTGILQYLAREYLEKRAPDQMAFGRVHLNTDHAHIHLMISSNGIRSSSRKRVSRARFAEIQREIEQLAQDRFPELKDRLVYTKGRDQQCLRSSSREAEHKQRTGRSSRKETIKQIFEDALRSTRNQSDLKQALLAHDLRLYRRGKQIGLETIKGGRKYRLKTLGSLSAFENWQQERAPAKDATDPVEAKPKIPVNDERAAKLLNTRATTEQFAERHLDDDWSR